MAAILILLIILGLVVGGIVANLYLYSQGAFARQEQGSGSGPLPSVGKDTRAEERFYARIGHLDASTEQYTRRVVSAFLVGMVVVCAILILFWQSLLH
jgi:hypothetical protein